MVKSTTILWRSHYNNGTNIGNTKDIVSTIVVNNGRDIVQGPYNNAAFLKVVYDSQTGGITTVETL